MKAGILLGQLNDTRNESALIRTAEGLGVNHVYIVDGSKSDLSSNVARGCDKHVSFHHFDSYDEFAMQVHEWNHNIVAIENTPEADPVEEDVDYPVNPIFVVGNEGQGVPKEIMRHADKTVKITQSPNSYVRCLNTTVSGSIVIHDWYSNRVRRDKTQKYNL